MADVMAHEAVALFRGLLAVPSPSGREERMGQLVRRKVEALGYAAEADGAGNVLVRVEGRQRQARPMVVAAHMDEIAMVVTAIEPDGKLRVDRSGGLYPYKMGECVVEIVGDAEATVPGVLSMGSAHTGDPGARVVRWADVRVITGHSPQRLGELGVRVGSTAVMGRGGRGPVVLGDGEDPLIGAWTFDDRGGVLTLLRLLGRMKQQKIVPARPTIVAFTVHEEGGCHGAKALAHRERPEIFVSVDGCPILPGGPVVADGRPAVWSMDTKCHYDQRLVKQLIDCGREAGVEVQTAVFREGAYSDASAVYDAGAAERVAIIGHARENSHGFEVLRLSALDNVLKVLEMFVARGA